MYSSHCFAYHLSCSLGAYVMELLAKLVSKPLNVTPFSKRSARGRLHFVKVVASPLRAYFCVPACPFFHFGPTWHMGAVINREPQKALVWKWDVVLNMAVSGRMGREVCRRNDIGGQYRKNTSHSRAHPGDFAFLPDFECSFSFSSSRP